MSASPFTFLIDTKRKSMVWTTLTVSIAAFVVGLAGGLSPSLFAGMSGFLALVIVFCFFPIGLRRATYLSFFLLLLASTKFRMRDAFETLAGNVDAQIEFELLCYGIVGAITLVNLASISRHIRKPSLVEITLFFFAVIAVASTAWSADPTLTAVRALELLILLIFVFVTTHVMTPEAMIKAIGATLILSVTSFSIAASVFPWANGTRIGYEGYARFSWFAVHPITAANEAAAALVFVIVEGLFAAGSWKRRIAGLPLWIYAIALFRALYATGTRASLGAAVVVISVLFIAKVIKQIQAGAVITRRTRMVTFIAVAVAAIAMVRFDVLHLGLHQYVYRYGEGSITSLNGRTDLWNIELGLFERKPFLGWGFLSCASVMLRLTPHGGEAHNVLLESLLDVGLIGSLFLWTPILATLAAKPGDSDEMTDGSASLAMEVKAILLLVLIEGMTDEVFLLFAGYDPAMTFGMIFAFWASRGRISQAQKQDPTPDRNNRVLMSATVD